MHSITEDRLAGAEERKMLKLEVLSLSLWAWWTVASLAQRTKSLTFPWWEGLGSKRNRQSMTVSGG
jgi:hypothetical protein